MQPHPNEKFLEIIGNDAIEVGILTDAGGRIALLRQPGGENLLLCDPELWDIEKHPVPEPSPEAEWKTYNGHIIWNGPQSGFWDQQDANPSRHGSVWPPDPYLMFGRFRIVEYDPQKIVLEGPDSPVTGLRTRKAVTLTADGIVKQKITVKNIRQKAVTWNIWSNTRVGAFVPSYVPVQSRQDVRVQNTGKDTVLHLVKDGYFSFINEKEVIPESVERVHNKAFINPEIPVIAAFIGDRVLLKRFVAVPADKIHPEHSLAEIYCAFGRDEANALQELEAQGPLVTLQPGESAVWTEEWEVLDYPGEDNREGHTEFLDSIIR